MGCQGCGQTFARHAGIPVFLSPEKYAECLATSGPRTMVLTRYAAARRQAEMTRLYYDWWVEEMLREVPADITGPMVELMCGGAEISRRLPARLGAAVAFDLNPLGLEEASEALKAAGEHRVTVVGGTAAKLPFASGTIPLVMIQGGLHHVRPILDRVLTEIARVLSPRGLLVASEPANDHPLIHRIRRWQYARSPMHAADEEGFSRTDLATFLTAAGMELVGYRTFGFLAYTLMGNTDLIPLLRTCSWAPLGHALLLADVVHARLPMVRRLAFASLFTAVKG